MKKIARHGEVSTAMFDLLSERDSDILLSNIEQVLPTLRMTVGLWVELGYAYKAKEIAERAVDECDRLLTHCQHHKRIERTQRVRLDAVKLSELFHREQQEHLHGDAEANFEAIQERARQEHHKRFMQHIKQITS